MTDLSTLSMSELVAEHNRLVQQLNALDTGVRKEAGPKTFSTKTKAYVRTVALATELDLMQKEQVEAVETATVVIDAPTEVEEMVDGLTDKPEAIVEPEATESQEAPAAQAKEPVVVEPDVQETEVEPTVTPIATNGSGQAHIIRTLSEELLLQAAPALSYEAILAEVKRFFPKSSTTIACLRWYAVRLRERGERVPNRPRAPRKQPEKKEG
jgi:hypothetical protein